LKTNGVWLRGPATSEFAERSIPSRNRGARSGFIRVTSAEILEQIGKKIPNYKTDAKQFWPSFSGESGNRIHSKYSAKGGKPANGHIRRDLKLLPDMDVRVMVY
jgi:hypothetical protein